MGRRKRAAEVIVEEKEEEEEEIEIEEEEEELEIEEEEELEIEEEEEETLLPPITLLELLTAYLKITESNGKTPSSYSVGMGEIYLAFQSRYPTGEDFAEALFLLIESSPDPVVRGYECDIQMVGEEYRSISFTPTQPFPKRGGKPPAESKEDIPPPPVEKTLPETLEGLPREYDEALRLSRCADQTFHEAEVKSLQRKSRWEAGSRIFEIEKLLRKAVADKSLRDIGSLVESLKV